MTSTIGKDEELFFWIKDGSERKSQGIQSIHKETVKKNIPKGTIRPRSRSVDSARAGLKDGWTRATFIVREENLKKIKDLAYWERIGIKEVLDQALTSYLKGKK